MAWPHGTRISTGYWVPGTGYAENPEKVLTEVITLSGLPNPAPAQSPEGRRSEASPKATFPLLQARSPKAPSVLHQPRRSGFELSSFEEASHSPATRPFPEVPLVPESSFSFPRNPVSPEGDTDTSAGRPQRPEGPPGTDNPYELPLPLRSPPKWLPRPKPLSFPNGPFRDAAVSESPPNRQNENLSATPLQRKPTPNQDFATRTQISRTSPKADSTDGFESAPNSPSTKYQVPSTKYQVPSTKYWVSPKRGKPRESSDRSHHPLGIPGPGNSSPEGSVFPKTPSISVATDLGPKSPLGLFSPPQQFPVVRYR